MIVSNKRRGPQRVGRARQGLYHPKSKPQMLTPANCVWFILSRGLSGLQMLEDAPRRHGRRRGNKNIIVAWAIAVEEAKGRKSSLWVVAQSNQIHGVYVPLICLFAPNTSAPILNARGKPITMVNKRSSSCPVGSESMACKHPAAQNIESDANPSSCGTRHLNIHIV